MRYVVVDAFFADARDLRRAIDRRLSQRAPPFDPERFVWEHWHVQGQFSQLRAPARAFFPAGPIDAFEARLLRWAASTYGLSRLGAPLWLSSVTDGGYQGLHRDGPNGTIAFTFALGRSARFRGGETLIARDELLDYFGTGSHRPEVAHTPLFDEIAPRFNRLVAFDARIPHAVRMVEGPRDAKDGRIAIQGWLEPDGCVVQGPLDPREATRAVNAVLRGASARALAGAEGLFAARLTTTRDGRVRRVEARASTLVRTSADRAQPARAERELAKRLARARFAPSVGAAASTVTAPVLVGPRGRARVL